MTNQPLRPSNALPNGYQRRDTFSLAHGQWRPLIVLNVLGAGLFFVFGWSFLVVAVRLRPELAEVLVTFTDSGGLLAILSILISTVLLIGLHEIVHGLFFYYYTRTRPKFGLSLFYAYAAAPGWYLPRSNYFIVALAPFAFITLVGLVVIPVIPLAIIPALLFGLTMNAAGSVGDFAVVIWLLRQPAGILIEDMGDSVNVFY